MLSDFIMKGPIDFAQRLLVDGNDDYPVYYYQLSYVSNYALHAQDGIPEPGEYFLLFYFLTKTKNWLITLITNNSIQKKKKCKKYVSNIYQI